MGFDPLTGAALIGVGGNLLNTGSKASAQQSLDEATRNWQSSEAEKDRALNRESLNRNSASLNRAYSTLLGAAAQGGEDVSQGTSAFMREANQENPYLSTMQDQLKNQSTLAQQQQAGQLNALFAQQGIRGPRAATIANRSMGDLNRNLQQDFTNLAYQDYVRRQNAKMGAYQNQINAGREAYYKGGAGGAIPLTVSDLIGR